MVHFVELLAHIQVEVDAVEQWRPSVLVLRLQLPHPFHGLACQLIEASDDLAVMNTLRVGRIGIFTSTKEDMMNKIK